MKPVPPVTSVGAIARNGRTVVVTASSRPALVTDTTSYLPQEEIDRHDIRLVSLYVSLEGEQQPEIELMGDLAGFYDRLKRSEEAVTTSQPSVGDFLEIYEPLLAEGREIVSIHISSGISGTFETATQARERLISEGEGGERVHLFDSATAAGGMGLVILAAANAIDAGASAADAVAKAQQARSDLKVWFAVDSLEYLRRGGRIGAAGAWIGTTLKIKPILTFEEEVEPVERVRTRSRAIERLVSYAQQRHEAGADAWVVQHIQDLDSARSLVERCRPIFGRDPVFTSEMGPVVGAHAGPGLLGIGSTTKAALGLE
jgi:DegV family protein with EDD domain